jgi:hypothetical protein
MPLPASLSELHRFLSFGAGCCAYLPCVSWRDEMARGLFGSSTSLGFLVPSSFFCLLILCPLCDHVLVRKSRRRSRRATGFRRLPAPPPLPRLPLRYCRLHFAYIRFWHRFYATRNDRHLKAKTRRRILSRLYLYRKWLREPAPSPYLLRDLVQLQAHIGVLDSRN